MNDGYNSECEREQHSHFPKSYDPTSANDVWFLQQTREDEDCNRDNERTQHDFAKRTPNNLLRVARKHDASVGLNGTRQLAYVAAPSK